MKSRSINTLSFSRKLLASALLLGLAALPLRAATITVISLADGGPGSLRQAILDSANGDVITFDPVLSAKTIALTNGELIVNKSLTINGLGAQNLAISGDGTSRVFRVTGSVTATINGLTIVAGAPVSGDGGGIHNEADNTLSVGSCVLTGNSGQNGGAIYTAGTLALTDSIIASNNADSGAGIYNTGTLTVTGSSLPNNSATVSGGGIATSHSLFITNSTFSANSSDGVGGAIYSTNGTLTVLGSTLTENTVVNGGGGIYADLGTTSIVNDSTISSNQASNESSLGGGIANFSSLTMSNCTVANNGGSAAGGLYSSNGVVTVLQSGINNNGAGGGGGVYNDAGSTMTIALGSTLTGNGAQFGGAIYSEGTLTVDDTTVLNNEAFVGGAMLITNSTVVISNSTVRANFASTAGAIYIESGTVLLTHSTVDFNQASAIGGIANEGFLTVDHSTIANNTSEDSGGGLANRGTLAVNESTVRDNSSISGGGIYTQGGEVTVVRSTISGNTAFDGVGGGINNQTGSVTVINSTLANNTAFAGGGIYNDGPGSLTIGESTFSGNFGVQGGALANSIGDLTIDNTILANSVESQNVTNYDGSVFISRGHNLSDDDSATSLLTEAGDLNNTSAGLDVLADNGGPTLTIALLPESPAIGAGGPLFAPFIPVLGGVPIYPPYTDQRGFPRFACGHMDIGAFEFETNTAPIVSLTLNGSDVLTNFCPNAVVDPGAVASNLCGSALAISGGGGHSLALRTDGSVAAWGDNSSGQTNIPNDLSEAMGVAAGGGHSLALESDGSVRAWGNNAYGQSTVPGTTSNSISVAAGGFHSLALETDGSVVAWGDDTYAQSTVPDAASNVVAVAAGRYHSLALLGDGTVIGWGGGTFTATPEDGINYSQVVIPEGLSNVVAIAAGGYHSAALKSDGTVVAWGAGTTTTSLFVDFGQSQVPEGLEDVIAIAAGGYHTLALKSDGSVVGWGNDAYFQSSGSTAINGAVAIAAGTYHSLAILNAGTVAGWGLNSNGATVATLDLRADLSSTITSADVGVTNGIGSFTRTYTVVDAAAVPHSITREIVTVATNLPLLTVPSDIIKSNDHGLCGAFIFYAAPTATDACGGTIIPVRTTGLASGSQFPVGSTLVTYTATDDSGNVTTASFTVTITDNEAPVIQCHQNITTTTAPGVCNSAALDFAPVVTDNCPGVTASCEPASGSTFAKGTNSVTCTATDAHENTASCSFTVIVEDREAPVLTCSGDIVTNALSVAGSAIFFSTSAVDNCGTVTVAAAEGSASSGDTFPVGNTIVARVATDSSGNQSFCHFTVTVVAPQLNFDSVLQDLLTLRNQIDDKADGKQIDHVIKDIVAANELWFSISHIKYKHGTQFFSHAAAAVRRLQSLIGKKNSTIPDATLRDLISRIVIATRVVAQAEVADAATANVNGAILARANHEIAEGIADGSTSNAIGHYRNAWKTAAKALNK